MKKLPMVKQQLSAHVSIQLLVVDGVTKCLKDGFSWTILKCSHDDKKFHSAQKTALMAECNTKLAIALSIMEESFLPMLDPRTGNNMITQFLYNWGSNMAQVSYKGFFAVALEKDDELFSVASIRVHGVTLAEMPLIATCIEQRRKGMCRRLVHVIEEMLKLLKVEMLVLPAIPYLVDTWISSFGFKHINDDDKKKLSRINLMMFPEATLLKKNLYKCEGNELGKYHNLPLSNHPSMEHTADIQAPVAGLIDALKYPSSSLFSTQSKSIGQQTSLISITTSSMDDGSGNNYVEDGAKNSEGMHENTEETNASIAVNGFRDEKDPYSEALCCYKSSLGEISNVSILRDFCAGFFNEKEI